MRINKQEAIYNILDHFDNAIFVTSCGMISRHAFDIGAELSKQIIPLTGSMGMTNSFSLGLAMGIPDRDIVAIMGDGDYIMGLNAIINLRDARHLLKSRLHHFILADAIYNSTGNQKLPDVDFESQIWHIYDEVKFDEEIDFSNLHKFKLTVGVYSISNDSRVSPRVPDNELPEVVKL